MKHHFIGIGGIGMSALAKILLQKGVEVSGSDSNAKGSIIDSLLKAGAKIEKGHKASNINGDMRVIYGSAVKTDNPEYVRAKELKLSMLHRSDLLSELMRDFKSLLVSGTHGKTTTTALLAHVLKEANKDPSYVIGGIWNNENNNGYLGKGDYFVAEADESDGSFLKGNCFGAILTSLDRDHIDFWKTNEALFRGFEEFCNKVISKEHFFWCKDDVNLSKINPLGINYGFSPSNLQASNFLQKGFTSQFDISFNGKSYKRVKISLAGEHNVLNALAVFGLSLNLNIDESTIRKAFLSFKGVDRRLSLRGEIKEVLFFDDYAHNPAKIRSMLKSLKAATREKRLVCIFQPHRYTRTADLLDEFALSFDRADLLFITDIYSAGEKPIKSISSKLLVDKIKGSKYIEREKLESIADFLMPHDVVITVGAGDISLLGSKIIEAFYEKNKKRKNICR